MRKYIARAKASISPTPRQIVISERKIIMYDIFGLDDFFNSFDVFPTYREVQKCPGCGQSYQNFRNTGKLGCAKCYDTFRTPVASTLKQIHQNVRHTGKIPAGSALELKKKRQYEDLKQQLKKAVTEENYELAAQLHKQLKALGDIN